MLNWLMAKLTNRFYNITNWQTLFTGLWKRLPLRLSKRQSPTTVLFRTTLTRTITQFELMLDKLKVLMFLLLSPFVFIFTLLKLMTFQLLWRQKGLFLENINNLSVPFNQVNHTSFGSHSTNFLEQWLTASKTTNRTKVGRFSYTAHWWNCHRFAGVPSINIRKRLLKMKTSLLFFLLFRFVMN